MSINGAMLAGVSGLSANAAALSSISQNIANVNTVGYKRTATEFATVVNSQSHGANYSAGGTKAATRHFISQTGLLQRTTSNTDLAIAGQGFFVVTGKSENLTSSDTRLFTRAGAFTVDQQGYLQNTAGYYLQGWPVDGEGNIVTDPSNMSLLRSINVGTVGGAAEPTTRVGLNANLKSSQALNDAVTTPLPAGVTAYDPIAHSMSAYINRDLDVPQGTVPPGVKPDFEITIPVSDSKGGQQNITLALLKSDEPNVWYAELVASDEDFVSGIAGANAGLIKHGKIAFTPDGRLDAMTMREWSAAGGPGDGLFDDPATASITIGASADQGNGEDGNWAESLGINAQTISFDLMAAAGGLTQYDSTSIVQATFTNGTTFGNLTEVKIDESGFVTAVFDNGVMRKIAQVALATFPSTDSLTEVSGNAYRVSQNSGTFNLKAPGTGGAGMLGASQLESSTVDLSTEFTGLITTQRAYSASSKIITTADEMLAELINIKR